MAKDKGKLNKLIKIRVFPTQRKQELLSATIDMFYQKTQDRIDCYWELEKSKSSYPPKDLAFSDRLGRDASVLAWRIVKSAKNRKGKKSKPEIKNKFIELNECSGKITGRITPHFDLWLSVIDANHKGHHLLIPGKKTKRFNQLMADGWSLAKGMRVYKKGKKWFADLVVTKERPEVKTVGQEVGMDIGFRHLLAGSDGAFYGDQVKDLIEKYLPRTVRCPKTIRHYINRTVKHLPWDSMSLLVVEDLKNLKKNKKGKWSKSVNRRFNPWQYAYLLRRLEETAQENGVRLEHVASPYTSQECSVCHWVDPENRKEERFRCVRCGHENHADTNAARNILARFSQGGFVPWAQGEVGG